jgi:LAGLIDADG-like domain
MNTFKEQCVALRKKGHTLSEIIQITGRPKSSVYGYIYGISLSPTRLQKIREASGRRIRKFALARKGKSTRTFRTFNIWTQNKVLLVGHLLFDGELTHGGCIYNSRSEILVERVQSLMREVYDFEPKHWKNVETGVNRISYHNVALSAYLREKANELCKKISHLSPQCKESFLKAFFDDEGHTNHRPIESRRSVRGYQKDIRILELTQALLMDLDINARIVKPNEVVIVGRENLIKFENEINFSSGVYINGNRSNSRWKKHIEKRELLKQAIKSFKS